MHPTLKAGHVTLRALTEGDIDLLMAILERPGVREWWGSLADPEHTIEGLRNDGGAFSIEVDGTLAGGLDTTRRPSPTIATPASTSSLHPTIRVDAWEAALRWRLPRGGCSSSAGTIASQSTRHARTSARFAAMRRVGFYPVGTMRRYERGADGSRHDNLLMDLLRRAVCESRPAATRSSPATIAVSVIASTTV